MFSINEWDDVIRPGYLGPRRDLVINNLNREYGVGNWTFGWWIADGLYTDFLGACALYEDAYLVYMKAHPEITEDLILRASNVYDVMPSDVKSGLNYLAQQHNRNHVQDIAIRRVLVRMRRWFQGTELIQIRFHDRGDPLSPLLTPGRVPYHLPEMVEAPRMDPHTDWYHEDSVEAFYQFNKHVLRRKGTTD